MKNNLKILFLLFSLILFISSCEKDLYDDSIYQENLRLEKISFSNLIKNDKFITAYSKIMKTKTNDFTNRTVMEEQYGFTIVDEPVNVLQNDTITSYSILITRDENPNNVVENLVIQINQNNETTANIIKYTSNIELYNGFDMDLFQGTKSITPIEYNANTVDSTAKIVYVEECTDVVIWHCYGPAGHTSSEGCTMGYATIETICYDVAVNTGGGLPGDGAGGSLSDIIVTAPNSGGGNGSINNTSMTNHCNSLKDKIDPTKANLKPVIDNLKTTLNQPGENGATFHKDENGNFLPPTNLPATTTLSIPMPHGGTIYGNVHTHPYTGSPMFSFADVFKLAQTYQECIPSNRNEVVMMLVVEYSPGVYETYAIVIDEPATFFDMVVNTMNSVPDVTTDKERINALDVELGSKYEKNTNYERTFLQHFAGFGMSLYKANQDLSKWSKLTCAESDTLNPNPQVQSTPCI